MALSTSVTAAQQAGEDGAVRTIRMNGAHINDGPGFSVGAAGDINGDGFADIVVGEPYADPNGRKGAGTAYVVFGRGGVAPASLDLERLSGGEGFRIEGVLAGDETGFAVTGAGDLNGDGFDDLVIGTHPDGATHRFGIDDAVAGEIATPDEPVPLGATYVLFGRASGFPARFDLRQLNGVSGFRIDAAAGTDGAGVSAAAAGDVNGDGIADLVIGAPWAVTGDRGMTGAAYVLYGSTRGFRSVVSLGNLDPRTGFRISGAAAMDGAGLSVDGAGDVNGDGIDDLIIGAPGAGDGDIESAGAAYVVFGRRDDDRGPVDLADLAAADGFRLDGGDKGEGAGISVAGAGDINGDGIADVVVGLAWADPGGLDQAGGAYVVYGRQTGFPRATPLADVPGAGGFRIDGAAAEDWAGYRVAAAGDVNADGIDDLLIGAPNADPNGNNGAGSTFVIFGRPGGAGGRVDLASGEGLHRFDGVRPDEANGASISSAGDFDGDGVDDILIGGRTAVLVFGSRALGGRTEDRQAPATSDRTGLDWSPSNADRPEGSLHVAVEGRGRVADPLLGIDCPGVCNAALPGGASVTLTATPGDGWTFTGWSGACDGTGACTLDGASTTRVIAKFAADEAGDQLIFADPERVGQNVAKALATAERRRQIEAKAIMADGAAEALVVFQSPGRGAVHLVASGGLLFPYGSNSGGGDEQLVVQPSQLISAAGRTFAVAVLRPDRKAAGPIRIDARRGDGPETSARIALAPVPLLLVHGDPGNVGAFERLHVHLARNQHPANPDIFTVRAQLDPAETQANLVATILSVLSDVRERGVIGNRVDIVAAGASAPLARDLAGSNQIGNRVRMAISLGQPEGEQANATAATGAAGTTVLRSVAAADGSTQSRRVYRIVTCLLQSAGDMSCYRSSAEQEATATPPRQDVRNFSIRVPRRAELSRPVTIALQGLDGRSARLLVEQRDSRGNFVSRQVAARMGANGRLVARFLPQLLGPVTLKVSVIGAEGAASGQSALVNVALPDRRPAVFRADANLRRIVLPGPGSTYRLQPAARFASAPGLDPLSSALYPGEPAFYPDGGPAVALDGHVRFRVLPGDRPPVVDVSADGIVTAQRPGVTKIETSFGNSIDQVIVIVNPRSDLTQLDARD